MKLRFLLLLILLYVSFRLGNVLAPDEVAVPVEDPVEAARHIERIQGHPTIIDGDSMRFGDKEVRLFGIDAFEMAQKCSDRDGRRYPCGDLSRQALESLTHGRMVVCLQREIDAYGRSVATCRAGEADLSAEQVREGYALAYRRYARDYIDLEKAARAAGRGAWGGRFDRPWDWRTKQREAEKYRP